MNGINLKREELRGYKLILQRFGFWFSEGSVGGVGFRVDTSFFCSLERYRGMNFLSGVGLGGRRGIEDFLFSLVSGQVVALGRKARGGICLFFGAV